MGCFLFDVGTDEDVYVFMARIEIGGNQDNE